MHALFRAVFTVIADGDGSGRTGRAGLLFDSLQERFIRRLAGDNASNAYLADRGIPAGFLRIENRGFHSVYIHSG